MPGNNRQVETGPVGPHRGLHTQFEVWHPRRTNANWSLFFCYEFSYSPVSNTNEFKIFKQATVIKLFVFINAEDSFLTINYTNEIRHLLSGGSVGSAVDSTPEPQLGTRSQLTKHLLRRLQPPSKGQHCFSISTRRPVLHGSRGLCLSACSSFCWNCLHLIWSARISTNSSLDSRMLESSIPLPRLPYFPWHFPKCHDSFLLRFSPGFLIFFARHESVHLADVITHPSSKRKDFCGKRRFQAQSKQQKT